uniref:natural killer cells antigen CD94-like n=1 Tax=Semicossyphus pulcher TaxID=241346 RepID=UPI0037E77161
MEEEVDYSSVVFKNAGAASRAHGVAAAHSHSRVLAVCLGILCVLLVTSIGAIVYISMVMNHQKANIGDLTAQIQQLNTEKSNSEKQTEQLSRVTDNLNRTLGVIMNFSTFPVTKFCPEKKCQPCQTGWILFQEKCYLFYKVFPWRTWQNSREYCQNTAADLVVIDSLQEQEFISKHIKYYLDIYHGFWLGLYESSDNNWLWVDGQNDTLGYWMTLGSSGPCGLMIPGKNLTASWDPAQCNFRNKFICESEVLIKSN